MYGLPHAGKISNDRLVKHLQPHGYAPVTHTPGLCKHHTRNITFTQVVDDFGIKYTSLADVTHLQNALHEQCEITTDMTISLYCGLTLAWNYNQRHVNVSMPGYVQRLLQRFNHPHPRTPQHSPHKWDQPIYVQKIQYAQDNHNLPILPPDQITRIQQIVGYFLFYA